MRLCLEIQRAILLNVIDNAWVDHLDAMEQLKTGIGLRAIGQLDPAVEFAKEGKNYSILL